MRSSNPVMSSLSSSQNQNQTQSNPFGQSDNPFNEATRSADRPLTVDDVVTKTGITLAVIIVMAVLNFCIGELFNPGLAMILTLVGAIGGLITVLVSTFGKKFGSAAVTLIYAVFEGLFVGGFSLLFAGVSFGNSDGMALIGQAIMGTVGVFIGMLMVYKTGAVKVTPKFNKIMFGLIAGVAVLALGNFLGAIFFGFNPLRDGGALAIIFSLVCIVLASLSFMTDFDQADRLIRQGAPAQYAWGIALGLAVTLVWLYTEILRLLSYFRD
ncbi:Bax inhibitor-1/YccA family protein [Corynebacterium minutissimum]|uniref:Bax inhibitor-1/YccA family protein n=1 Tax=Corynebacterium minutissimum TaxID=38301 RepID=A0A7T2XJV6_9CORY|nr:Bax inhibitor-1/YccA family protein [Corynebacterium minutissimum]KHO29799.1 membrane protein [Corynebacterium minutissimum]QPS58578.1 Bax inhibitor-1/YccA family protein [Corynebacterium minutissimum]QQA78430.1 Bax inhibitor-1/YccA family protein [Corynebacterium minutissimum]